MSKNLILMHVKKILVIQMCTILQHCFILILLVMIQQQYCEDYILIENLATFVAYFSHCFIFCETCEVWPESPVPWAAYGYLCVMIQCRCIKRGTFVPSDLI